jgi:hypothetical protein
MWKKEIAVTKALQERKRRGRDNVSREVFEESSR